MPCSTLGSSEVLEFRDFNQSGAFFLSKSVGSGDLQHWGGLTFLLMLSHQSFQAYLLRAPRHCGILPSCGGS